MKGLEQAAVVLGVVAAVSLIIYDVFNEPPALFGAWAAGFVFLIVILNEFMKTKQRPGEQVNY